MKNTDLRRAIADAEIENYGFSNEGYGFDPRIQAAMAAARPGSLPAPPKGGATYSVNPAIQSAGQGASSMRVTITCTKNGTGSGNTSNPVFLFGGDAFTNASRGYNAVRQAGSTLTTSTTVSNNKNVVSFRYGDGTNNATYLVTLDTAGEYPFVLSTLTGNKKLWVTGAQMEISDATQTTQLTSTIQKFELDEFGKATTNDLTTPKDLYQQATNGIFLPHTYSISGREGLIVNVLEVDAFSVSFYFTVNRIGG